MTPRGEERKEESLVLSSFLIIFYRCVEMNSNQKLGLTILIICLITWFFIIPSQVVGVRESIYPRFVTIWLAISSFLFILYSRKGTTKKISHGLKNKKGIGRVIVTVLTFLIYILMIDFLGFFIPSILFLIINMLVFGERDWMILILIPGMLLLFIHFFIEKLLFFPLPKGRIF